MVRSGQVLVTTIGVLVCVAIGSATARAQEQTVTIRAARVLDGKGGSLQNATVEVKGGAIVKVDQRTGPVTYDLGNVTLLPGMIDTHVHIGYHFGKDGRAQNDGETPAEMALYAAENAWTTLVNGFTTVQSVGAASDKDLRDAIARGVLPGPRILTSLGSMSERTGTPDQMRDYVRKQKQARRRSDQDLRVEEHSRGRRPDDDRRAAGGGLR